MKNYIENNKERFTELDRYLLKINFGLADVVAEIIGSHCEIVIHSLENLDSSVVKIVNGFHTGRVVGSPMTDMGLKILRAFETTGKVNSKAYFTRSNDGSMLKSITYVIKNHEDRAIGLFCININLSFPFLDIIETLMPTNGSPIEKIENFGTSPIEVIEHSLDIAMRNVSSDASVTLSKKNRIITNILFEQGIFEFKEATLIVSKKLGLTRHAIYKYIREFKSNRK